MDWQTLYLKASGPPHCMPAKARGDALGVVVRDARSFAVVGQGACIPNDAAGCAPDALHGLNNLAPCHVAVGRCAQNGIDAVGAAGPGKDLAAPRVDDGALELLAAGEHAVSEGCDYVQSAVALAEDVAA